MCGVQTSENVPLNIRCFISVLGTYHHNVSVFRKLERQAVTNAMEMERRSAAVFWGWDFYQPRASDFRRGEEETLLPQVPSALR